VKHSFSLSDDVSEQLKETARVIPSATPSLLADFALKQLLDRPVKEITEMLNRYKLERKAPTRDWWQTSFWTLLSERMGTFDPITNPYVPRDYEDYYLVQLRSRVAQDDEEGDPFYVHMGPRAGTSGPTKSWEFMRTTSPAQAAQEVAAYLKDLGVVMDYEGRVQKVKTILAQRLGADPNNSDRFGNGQFAFAMDYGPEGQRGTMIWQIVRLDSPERPSTRLALLWRSNTAKQIADFLINAYEKLEPAPR
jgi:hypothetical protein